MRYSADFVSVSGPVAEDDYPDTWPKVEGFITESLARDDYKHQPEDVLQQIAEGMMGLYLIEDDVTGELLGALCAEVQEYPHANVFNLAYCGGHDLHRWANLLGGMEFEAARLGCDTLRITGRPGWGRIFPDYREIHRVFERKVVQ